MVVVAPVTYANGLNKGTSPGPLILFLFVPSVSATYSNSLYSDSTSFPRKTFLTSTSTSISPFAMAEPSQVRRYLTRARAKADENPVDLKLSYQSKGQKAAGKQKTIVLTDTESSASSDTVLPAASAISVSKRTTVPKETGVKAAPKRKSTRSGGGTAKKTVASKASAGKSSKKVTFNDDKENVVPSRRELEATRQESDDTDELMSSSMGALSVKPLRVPSTKLRLPSSSMNVTSAFDPLPALSPSKARRPPRALTTEDEEMEDELSGPMSPALKFTAKPKRGGALSARSLTEAAGGPRRPLDLSASLLTSPARRPPTSPFKPTTANTTFSKSSTDAPNAVLRPSLTSPARRPYPSGLGNPTKGGFRLESNVTLGMDIPDLSKPGARSPPKRVKMSGFVKADESEDELAMHMDNHILGRSPSRFVKKCTGGGSIRKFSVNHTNPNLGASSTQGDVPRLSAFSNVSNMPLLSIMGEDSTMEGLEDAGCVTNQMSPTAKKYKGQPEGGNSYVFFDLEKDEEDEQSNLPHARNLFSSFFGTELQPERKKLFPDAFTSKRQEDRIPIDPFLLTLDAPDNFLGIIGSPSRKITVPVKLNSVDDMISEDEDFGNQENQQLSDPLIPSTKDSDRSASRSRGIARTSGVLAGAVVFVDVYTSEGADASAAFVEALRGLGAKVLKSWNWNPNSTGGSGGKVGITHVVFKDGSPRTLQKLKDSKGVVLCVGVGWVTSCEEEQTWIDEGIYPVDLDHVPRGGHRVSLYIQP